MIKFLKDKLLSAYVLSYLLNFFGNVTQLGLSELESRKQRDYTVVGVLERARDIIIALRTSLGNVVAGLFMGKDFISWGLEGAGITTTFDWGSLTGVEMGS